MSEDNSYVFAYDFETGEFITEPLWYNEGASITSVEIGSNISPISTAWWFCFFDNLEKGNFSKLNTSEVTDMEGMFGGAGAFATTFNIGDLSNWDTSQVTDMSSMFQSAGSNATTFNIGDLSNWDTSQVTDMSNMFNSAGSFIFDIGDLSNWDTSQVTNMYGMFAYAGYSANWHLDCSKWNVNKVTSHDDFNMEVTSKVIPPVWVN